jgi:hypothetical protein
MLNYDFDGEARGNSALCDEVWLASWERAYPAVGSLLSGVLGPSKAAEASAERRRPARPDFQPEYLSGLCASS